LQLLNPYGKGAENLPLLSGKGGGEILAKDDGPIAYPRTAEMVGTEAWTCGILLNATADRTWML